MSPGDAAARAGLAGSVDENRQQVALTEESRKMLQSVLRDDMGNAFEAGLTKAMSSENARLFVRAMLTEAQKMAAEKSVEVAGGALKALIGKALLFLFLGSIVYAFGGWSALAALAKFLASREG